MSNILLTVPQVAERLKLSRAKVYGLLDSGKLKSVKIDRSRRITNDQLDSFISGLENGDN